MKKILLYALILCFFSMCTKTIHDRRPNTTVSPESREYFGCRINGRGFVSEARTGNVSGFCSYVDSYSNSTKTFRLFSDKFESVTCKSGTVGFTLDSVELIAGKRYNLGTMGEKKNYGSYFMVPGCAQNRVDMFTTDGDNSYVIIKKVDFRKKVVTGTFNMVVRDPQGSVYQITDGIFDRHFTTE